ncbi:endolytic transglycosylase MltG [Paracoccus aminophilus]|uniref:Endolytic murein transglycosylase n=1 Tax=Paracoccus aminophilus JCM 7686 TaxID=1367847 RepID=S5XKF8_PARAH|nr:endolytic transglycosylase MltG [Paracoccus aminophilus]AGT07699.1 aminodeoxychorismate lyase [Paracoccus aminophilus JCM 7686]
MWRNLASNLLTLLVLALVAAAGAIAWAKHAYVAEGPSKIQACVQVPPGASLSAVSQRLAEQGVVSNAYIFRAGADYSGKARDLKYGSYLVPAGVSMEQVAAMITAGGPSTCGTEVTLRIGVRENSILLRDMDPATGQYAELMKYDPATMPEPVGIANAVEKPDARLRITIAEGVTSWQIVEGLKAASFLAGDVAKIPAEGSLAPDTYEVKKDDARQALLDAMANKQSVILQNAWDGRAPDLPYKTPAEALVMASIVEKETGVAAERPVVASVFVNRLNQGMKLETDPTVIYGVTKGQAVLDRGLRRSELRTRTAYNTYVIQGLPPTPIANPGKAAIEATLHPAATDYIFFVADGTGGHAFGRTLEEHNANVARWREIEAQQGQPTDSPVQGAN